MAATEPLAILVVEDDPVDVSAIRRALRGLDGEVRLEDVGDGREALERLRTSVHEHRRGPLLVVDLNMPRMGGLELLDHLRADPVLCRAVVFVFSSSELTADIERAYSKQIAGYVVKAVDRSGHRQLADLVAAYARGVRFAGEVDH